MDNLIPKLPQYDFIAERLTDKDLMNFNLAIEEYMACNYGSSDYCVAQMDRRCWKMVHRYLDDLDRLYDEAGGAE